MNIHYYVLVDFIFDGRLSIQQLIERSNNVFNSDKLDNDFWFYLLFKYISYRDGSTDEVILLESLNETDYYINSALVLYSQKLEAKNQKQKTLDDLVRETEVNYGTSIGLVTLKQYSKLSNPPFTMNELFQALYCKAKNIDVEIYYILQKFATYLRERPTDEISVEGLFNELLEFSRKVDEAYENLATRTIKSLQNEL